MTASPSRPKILHGLSPAFPPAGEGSFVFHRHWCHRVSEPSRAGREPRRSKAMRSVGSSTLLLAALVLGAMFTSRPAHADDPGADPFNFPMDVPAFGEPDGGSGSPRAVQRSTNWLLVWGRLVVEVRSDTSKHLGLRFVVVR